MTTNESRNTPKSDRIEKRSLFNEGANIPMPSSDEAKNPFAKITNQSKNTESKEDKKK